MEKDINFYINEMKNIYSRATPARVAVPTVNEALQSKTPMGWLKIFVSHSQNTFPISGAEYFVYDKNGSLLKSGATDISGTTENIALPAIPKALSEKPGADYINSAVFYDIEIKADGYIPIKIINVPVFEDITTIQNFDLTFLAASPNGLPQVITLPTENTL